MFRTITTIAVAAITLLALPLAGCGVEPGDATDESESVDTTEEALVASSTNLLKSGNFNDAYLEEIPNWKTVAGARGHAMGYVYSPGGNNHFVLLRGGRTETSHVSQTVRGTPNTDYQLTFKAAAHTPEVNPKHDVLIHFLDADKKVLETKRKDVAFDLSPEEGDLGTGRYGRPFKKNTVVAASPPKTAFVRVTFLASADPPRGSEGSYDNAVLSKR